MDVCLMPVEGRQGHQTSWDLSLAVSCNAAAGKAAVALHLTTKNELPCVR